MKEANLTSTDRTTPNGQMLNRTAVRENMPPRFGVKGERRCKKKITNIYDSEPEYIRQHSSYQKMTEIPCSICAERRPAVQLCLACNEQDDKRVCEACAVRMHNGCANPACSCFGFICAFCRHSEKTPRDWTQTSLKYWKARAYMLGSKLEVLAVCGAESW